jgi:hypothetical protein
MLELKVRPLTASHIEFLSRWDAEDDDVMSDFLRLNGQSPVYARSFACFRCGLKAYEIVKVSPAYPGQWLWSSNCCDVHCAPRMNFVQFTAWAGWKIGRGCLVPLLARKARARMDRLDIVVPEDLGGEIVWRRGVATFRTIMQAGVASPRNVRRLGRLQTLKTLGRHIGVSTSA